MSSKIDKQELKLSIIKEKLKIERQNFFRLEARKLLNSSEEGHYYMGQPITKRGHIAYFEKSCGYTMKELLEL